MLKGSPKGIKVKGKLSELLMLQFNNELERYLEASENEMKLILERCKDKVRNHNLYNKLLLNVIHYKYKNKRSGFLELIENSLDSMHYEGGDLNIKISEVNNNIQFSITDIGHGMTTKDLISYLIIPFKSTRALNRRTKYYGGTGLGFGTIMDLCDSVVVITSSGDGVNELELTKKGIDWEYHLTTREGKVTGTTIIGNLKHHYTADIENYIKKYFYFVDPSKYRVMINGERINYGKKNFKGLNYKYNIQKNGQKSNIFLYAEKDNKKEFNIYWRGKFVKSYKDTLKKNFFLNGIISALMHDVGYSFIIELPEIIELCGSKDDYSVDDVPNVENTIRKMLESFIISEILTNEDITGKINQKLVFLYDIIFREIWVRDRDNVQRGYKQPISYVGKDPNFSTYVFRKISTTKFIDVIQLKPGSHPKKIKLSPEEFYDNLKRRYINYIPRMAKLNTGIFVEEGNPALQALMNTDSSFYNFIRMSKREEVEYNETYTGSHAYGTYGQYAEKQYGYPGKQNRGNNKVVIIERTPLSTIERIMNIDKKAGDYVVLLRILKYLDKVVCEILKTPASEIMIHSNLTVSNNEKALINEHDISVNISNNCVNKICSSLLNKNITTSEIIKLLDLIITQKAKILSERTFSSEYFPQSFYDDYKVPLRNKFINTLIEKHIDISKETSKIAKSRPHTDKVKLKDLMKLIKKHSINNFNGDFNRK